MLHKMHANELDTDVALVKKLLSAQFPQWANLAIQPVDSDGTDNAIYRLGDEMCVRIPRIASAAKQLEKEQKWLPKIAASLSMPIPQPFATGEPTEDVPWMWCVYSWVPGRSGLEDHHIDLNQAATDLGNFVVQLQRIDATGGPPPGRHNFFRGVHLAERDAQTREAIAAVADLFDAKALTAAWEIALSLPQYDGPPVWIHGDIQPGNILFHDGKVSGVIDFGALAVGDPACDLMVGWDLFGIGTRETFRSVVQADDATWGRARGWALSVAVIALPYYRETNQQIVTASKQTINAVLGDYDSVN